MCRAPTERRTELAKKALELPGVVNVREMTTGGHNIHIEMVAVDSDASDEARIGLENLEDLEIMSTQIIGDLHVQPFNHFGADVIKD